MTDWAMTGMDTASEIMRPPVSTDAWQDADRGADQRAAQGEQLVAHVDRHDHRQAERLLRRQQGVAGTALARNLSGTLKLAEDSKGLQISASLDPDNPDAMTAISALRRGDITEMSFAFQANVQDWIDDDKRLPLRILREVSLFDISLVNLAAYPTTSVGLAGAA